MKARELIASALRKLEFTLVDGEGPPPDRCAVAYQTKVKPVDAGGGDLRIVTKRNGRFWVHNFHSVLVVSAWLDNSLEHLLAETMADTLRRNRL